MTRHVETVGVIRRVAAVLSALAAVIVGVVYVAGRDRCPGEQW